MKILIADANIEHRFQIRILLRPFEVEFQEARNSFEAVSSALEFKPDLIVLDYQLPPDHAFPTLQKIEKAGLSVPSLILLKQSGELDLPSGKNIQTLPFPAGQDNLHAALEKLLPGQLSVRKEAPQVRVTSIKKVLIAEDTQEIRFMLTVFLGEKYEVGESSDGEELIEKTRIFKPDLIITDVVMPRLSGWRAVKKIREENSDFENIPVIFISGLVKDRDLYETLKPSGPSAFLLKPFSKDQLMGLISGFIESK